METYFTIMNLLDEYALNGKQPTANTILFLDCLAEMEDFKIEDIADANDCGKCETWADLINGLAENFKTGNRI